MSDERRYFDAIGLAHPSDPVEYYPNGLRRPFWEVMEARARNDGHHGRMARQLLGARKAWLSELRRNGRSA